MIVKLNLAVHMCEDMARRHDQMTIEHRRKNYLQRKRWMITMSNIRLTKALEESRQVSPNGITTNQGIGVSPGSMRLSPSTGEKR